MRFPSVFSVRSSFCPPSRVLGRVALPLVLPTVALLVVPSVGLAQGLAKPTPTAPKIVASVPYVADLVAQLGCQESPLSVETIVDGGKNPHSYSSLPGDQARIAASDLFVFVHASFESWLPMRIRAGKGAAKAKAFALTEGLSLKGNDPHIWHSPQLTVEASKRLAKRLGELIPSRASEFTECQRGFEAAVAKEVDSLRTLVSSALPEKQRWLATNHDAFGYFAEAFGFQVLAVQGLSTAASPTPARLKAVIDGVRKSGARAVFLEASVPARTMETVAKEAGVRVGGSLYADGLGEPGSGAETTLALWRKNVETVVSALKEPR